MKNIKIFSLILCLILTANLSATVMPYSFGWINEVHYDNDGTDSGEFVEVIVFDWVPAEFGLANLTLELYNGSGGAQYGIHTLDSFTEGQSVNGYTVFYKSIPGIQNGSPDGLSFSFYSSEFSEFPEVYQFLSYEGSFTATGGNALGLPSTDIGISEPGTIAVGSSLGLTGNGLMYEDFSWAIFEASATPGTLNIGQQLIPEPSTYAFFFGLGVLGLTVIRRRSRS